MQQPLDGWEAEFEAFHARFAPLFGRREPREQSRKYLRGLMGRVERKNCWQLAEAVGDGRPDSLQRILYQCPWDEEAARDLLQEFVVEGFGDADGIGVVDETGFVKKGRCSVGVKRQYSGTAGKIENCQVGVFMSYVTPRGHTFLDRRLYLPEDWCKDLPRRQKAGVPEAVEFRTKPQLALEMVRHAGDQGVPLRWVTGDEIYGDAGYFRQGLAEQGLWYVLAVSASTPIWRRRPRVQEPWRDTGGRPRTRARLAPQAPPTTLVREVVAGWAPSRWQRLEVAPGEKGPRVYDWAAQRVVESQQGLPGETVWLVGRRAVSDPNEIAYYLSNAPANTPLDKLALVASARWTVEQCFEEAKGETGLDHYEVRTWHSWHRHITLSMMAHAWLASIRRDQEPKRGLWTKTWPN
jgi:SRSO17 transposase